MDAARGTCGSSTTPSRSTAHAARSAADAAAQPAVPDDYAAAFARVQEELHAGNSYEVNLTYRVETRSDLDPATAYLRLRELNPAPYAGFLQHDVAGAPGLAAAAPRPSATR